MGRRTRSTAQRVNKRLAALGAILVLAIAMFAGAYLALGMPVFDAERVDTTAFKCLTSTGVDANVTNVATDGRTLEFTPGAACSTVEIPLKDKWSDVKGSFNTLHVDLSEINDVAVWELAKVYATDGTVDVYLGAIKEESKAAALDVDPDDLKSLDDLATAKFVIKFYDESGSLVDALGATVQEIEFYSTVTAETSTIWGFFISIGMALVLAIRKILSAITTALTSAFLAVTTNSALLTIIGALAVVFLAVAISERKGKLSLPW